MFVEKSFLASLRALYQTVRVIIRVVYPSQCTSLSTNTLLPHPLSLSLSLSPSPSNYDFFNNENRYSIAIVLWIYVLYDDLRYRKNLKMHSMFLKIVAILGSSGILLNKLKLL